MAKLIDQLLSITGLKPPESGESYSSYHTDGLTGVERYLARQVEEDARKAAAEKTLTGVEKYLQRQAEAVETNKVEDIKEVSAPVSGVARYLEKQAKQEPTKVTIQKPESSVDKYIEEHPEIKKEPVAAPKTTAKPAAKKPTPAKKPVSKPKPAATTAKEAPIASGTINLSVDVKRCQAGTGKGGQCKRTTSLMKIQRTINKQKYQFIVCSQHHNDKFKPYKGLIKD